MLPNLSQLSIGEKLFEFISEQGVGKEDGCNRHKEPVETKDDESNNCAVDGYLMFKELGEKEDTYKTAQPTDGSNVLNISLSKPPFGIVKIKILPKHKNPSIFLLMGFLKIYDLTKTIQHLR